MIVWVVVTLYLANVLEFTVRMRDFRRPSGMPRMMLVVMLGGLTTTLVTVHAMWSAPAPVWRLRLALAVLPASGALFMWAIRSARAHGFGIAFSDHVPATLVTTGAYAWLRHPLYVAYAATWAAGAVASTSWAPMALTVGMSLLYLSAALMEDRQLRG